MALLYVNNSIGLSGHFSVASEKIVDEAGNISIIVYGELKSKKYIEEITRIETVRYIIEDIDVTRESFGSDDDYIVYSFNARNIIVKEDSLDFIEPEDYELLKPYLNEKNDDDE